MKEKSPAFQFYAKDWLADSNVIAMPANIEGCYIRLLAICWLEGSIPLNFQHLLKGGCQLVEPDLELLKKCFKTHPKNDQLLIHPRLEKERKKQKEWKKKSSLGGKKSANTRKQKTLLSENGSNQNSTTLEPPLQPKGNSSFSSSSSSSSSKKHIKGGVDESELSKSQIALIFESRWLAYRGEKDNKKIALSYWKTKIKTEQDVKNYDQAVENYYAIVTDDRKNGFPERRFKGGKTWFNNYESYIDQKPPTSISKDGMQPQKQLQEKELKKYCKDQLVFVETEMADGCDGGYQWFHAALNKRVLEYEQRFGKSPFDLDEQKIYEAIKTEMMRETDDD